MNRNYRRLSACRAQPVSAADWQYARIRALANDHMLRAESMAREVTGKGLAGISRDEADCVIAQLEGYRVESDALKNDVIQENLGHRLDETYKRSNNLWTGDYVLALLAYFRVATPGQCARFTFGVWHEIYDSLRDLVEPVLDHLLSKKLIGRKKSVTVQINGVDAVTDVLYLTEDGSDLLHAVMPHVNFYARPGLPDRRISHDLGVTEALLEIQSRRNVDFLMPERAILGDQARERSRDGGGSEADTGSGDFRCLEQDPRTDEWQQVEVEVSNLQRGEKLRRKPSRVGRHFASSVHLLDVIEMSFGQLGQFVPDVRRPLRPGEELAPPARPRYSRRAVTAERLAAVERAFFGTLGGAATVEAVARVVGTIRPNEAGEALNFLEDEGCILHRDGCFPLSKKLKGRPLRIFHGHCVEAASPYDFARLMTASKLVSTGLLGDALGRELCLLCHDPGSGLMVFCGPEHDPEGYVVVVVDDESEAPGRVAAWASAAALLASSGELLRGSHDLTPAPDEVAEDTPSAHAAAVATVVIATSDAARAGALRGCAHGPVICVV